MVRSSSAPALQVTAVPCRELDRDSRRSYRTFVVDQSGSERFLDSNRARPQVTRCHRNTHSVQKICRSDASRDVEATMVRSSSAPALQVTAVPCRELDRDSRRSYRTFVAINRDQSGFLIATARALFASVAGSSVGTQLSRSRLRADDQPRASAADALRCARHFAAHAVRRSPLRLLRQRDLRERSAASGSWPTSNKGMVTAFKTASSCARALYFFRCHIQCHGSYAMPWGLSRG